MRKFIIPAALLFTAAALFACSGKGPEEGQAPPAEGPVTLTIASSADGKRLIPMLATDTATFGISGRIFNGLTRYDKDLKIAPELAESWDVSPDGLDITFQLRKDVRWQDGEPFTSADVLFTYKALRDPAVATPYSDSLGPLESVGAPDEYTVKVRYKEPFAPALEAWGMGIIPKHLLEGQDINTTEFNRSPVGTGPFKMGEWVTGERITLVANDDYFLGRPRIDRIVTRVIPEQSTRFLELKAGGIDFMALSPVQYARQTDSGEFGRKFQKLRYPDFIYTYMGYNLKDERFRDIRVRKALTYAINKEAIIQGVLLGLGSPCTGPLPPKSWAYNPDVKPYPYDPEKAKSLLAEAGWKDTDGDGYLDKDGERFSFTIITNQGNDERKKTAEIIQQNLKEIGIEVKLKILEWQAFIHDFVDKGKFEAIILGWSLTPDPDMYDIWHSSKTKEGEFNFVGYKNEEVDRLLVEGRQNFDIEKRKEIYHRIHEILADEVPYTFLYVPDALPVLDRRFKGVKVEPAGIWYNYEQWYVPKERSEWYE